MAMPAAKKCRKHHDQSNVMQYLVLTIVILIFKKDGIVNSIFLDPQKYNICVNKILWIHKNMKSIVSKFCGSTKKTTHSTSKFLWIHKILSYMFTKFCGSTKFWHIQVHNFVVQKKRKKHVNQNFTDSRDVDVSTSGTLLVYKLNIITDLTTQFRKHQISVCYCIRHCIILHHKKPIAIS